MDWSWAEQDIVTGVVRTGGVASRIAIPWSLLVGDIGMFVECWSAQRMLIGLRCEQAGDAAGAREHLRVLRCLARWQRCRDAYDGVAYDQARSEPLLAVRMLLGIDEVDAANADRYVSVLVEEARYLAEDCCLVPGDECRFLLVAEDDVVGLYVTKHLHLVTVCRGGLPAYLVSGDDLAERIKAWK